MGTWEVKSHPSTQLMVSKSKNSSGGHSYQWDWYSHKEFQLAKQLIHFWEEGKNTSPKNHKLNLRKY